MASDILLTTTSAKKGESILNNTDKNLNGKGNHSKKVLQRKKFKNSKKKKKSPQDIQTINNHISVPKVKKKKDFTAEKQACFTVLQNNTQKKKVKANRVLPNWMSHPSCFSKNLSDGCSIDSFECLDEKLKANLRNDGLSHFFPVQEFVIKEVLSSSSPISMRFRPHDICVAAPTGSGKTLAYVLPIVQLLKDRIVPQIRAIAVLPVQELAVQVYQVFVKFASCYSLKVGLFVGSQNYESEKKFILKNDSGRYYSNIDILVATPTRLLDHIIHTEGFDLSHLRFFILDEVDRMLSEEGGSWIGRIEKAVMQQVPSVLANFSFPALRDISSLNKFSTIVRPEELEEQFINVAAKLKPLLLHHILTDNSGLKTLVFANSLAVTYKLFIVLKGLSNTYKTASFSSKSGVLRKKILTQFRNGAINVLISTDALARGIDISDIDRVICYEVCSPSHYIHRVGRTARAGRSGDAITLVTPEQKQDFNRILKESKGCLKEVTVDYLQLNQYKKLYASVLTRLKKGKNET